KNIYGQYGQTILEMAQVPAQRQKDVLKLIVETMEGRYGEDGSRAVFQMIQEQNPTAGDELYVKIQQQIQSGRAEFKTAQSVLLDQKAAY
uniref:hypothetical protein n=1 Tax=Vibrio vulnificus TaxID=672 RepID=UPI0039B69316